MRKFFLTSSPDRIFLVIGFLPFVVMWLIGLLFGYPETLHPETMDRSALLSERIVMFVRSGLFLFAPGFFLWAYFVGTSLNSYLPAESRKSTSLFVFALLIVPALKYVPAFVANVIFSTGYEQYGIGAQSLAIVYIRFGFWFYFLSFLADRYNRCTKGRGSKLTDVDCPFFLFWFYLLGIWVIQPKINRLFSKGIPSNGHSMQAPSLNAQAVKQS